MQDNMTDNLCANAIGREVFCSLRNCDPNFLITQAEQEAIRLLSEIQNILNDATLSDPECFYRIDEIVSVFHRAGLSTTRHEEAE